MNEQAPVAVLLGADPPQRRSATDERPQNLIGTCIWRSRRGLDAGKPRLAAAIEQQGASVDDPGHDAGADRLELAGARHECPVFRVSFERKHRAERDQRAREPAAMPCTRTIHQGLPSRKPAQCGDTAANAAACAISISAFPLCTIAAHLHLAQRDARRLQRRAWCCPMHLLQIASFGQPGQFPPSLW